MSPASTVIELVPEKVTTVAALKRFDNIRGREEERPHKKNLNISVRISSGNDWLLQRKFKIYQLRSGSAKSSARHIIIILMAFCSCWWLLDLWIDSNQWWIMTSLVKQDRNCPPPSSRYIPPNTHTHIFRHSIFCVCVTYPDSRLLLTHSSHWYLHTIHPHKQTHGITMLRLPYTLLHVCLCIKLQWQGADKRQCCSDSTHSWPLTGLNDFLASVQCWYKSAALPLYVLYSHNHWWLRLKWATWFYYYTLQMTFRLTSFFFSCTDTYCLTLTLPDSESLGRVLIYYRRVAHALTNN